MALALSGEFLGATNLQIAQGKMLLCWCFRDSDEVGCEKWVEHVGSCLCLSNYHSWQTSQIRCETLPTSEELNLTLS